MTDRFLPAAMAAALVLAGATTAAAFQYPVAGADNDPNFCSSRREPVMFCFTPPPGTHCEALQNEETPLYLGYRYYCDPAPVADAGDGQAQVKPAPARTP
jgi:hypothetical protein